MKVLLIGGGGREHALGWRIADSPLVDELLLTDPIPGLPGRVVAGDPVEVAAAEGVGLVVVGPEKPLAEGLVDRLAERGVPALGPTAAAARLESSKAFAKAFMDRHGIPTARWSVHADPAEARAAAEALLAEGGGVVIKADGLAGGKGVVVADHAADAIDAIDEALLDGRFGEAGRRVIVEERLRGPELSVIALCDGRRAVPLLPCRDHKRRFDEDRGPNTGGMGAICPVPGVTPGLVERVRARVLQPVVDGMAAEGHPFRGVLYAGLILTTAGPRVLEFNVRFGDPECQPLMMMLDEDPVPWFLAAAAGELPERTPRWRPGAACCVVMVDGDYPGPVAGGAPIEGVPEPTGDARVFFAGARLSGDPPRLLTAGGRVLGAVARGADLAEARRRAYALVEGIRFAGAAWRTDIGAGGAA